MSVTVEPVAPARRHTLYFLDQIRSFSPVFLDTEVDMTQVLAHRAARREVTGRKLSLVTYIVAAGGRTLAAHPEANASIRGWLRPVVARHPQVNGKVTFDRTMGGRRVVLATVVPDVAAGDLDAIQDRIEQFRDLDPDTAPALAPIRKLQGLPVPLGRLLAWRAARPPERRALLLGTFAVTSLGHRPVDGFHSVGGTTVTLGVGRVLDRPVARDGRVEIAPVLRLSLAFDHRVIDGAEAADVLAGIRRVLEEPWPQPTAESPAVESPVAESPVARLDDIRPAARETVGGQA
ncbi:2-oxo acid dehydrogenase subunit E2 [Parafrankia sp. EUN1f]|uniref:2-oxo acid dehydrogenase subunit E2 n=1 Tax=Parafrankia sp. EUN1f TaxID=102897 RepID=UPI0001C463B9|nr:2-oxo acid dehydrogenase subunit E2 [Parafrankia sp. EUN1f]EFC81295.1 catalytic domain of component of various dehydrogenase complexes [Parafrankia sp. EUN1f]